MFVFYYGKLCCLLGAYTALCLYYIMENSVRSRKLSLYYVSPTYTILTGFGVITTKSTASQFVWVAAVWYISCLVYSVVNQIPDKQNLALRRPTDQGSYCGTHGPQQKREKPVRTRRRLDAKWTAEAMLAPRLLAAIWLRPKFLLVPQRRSHERNRWRGSVTQAACLFNLVSVDPSGCFRCPL